ncbi:NAD-dependent epimerase/dehydratase family protein [Salinisphaera aquimarina]|uniref:NAD-dependent epimerase/dehydratase family protein n=1 Tax=Salinisphaera aquimarina TaxID=2094031 RepID=A0ABV7EV79_9GAMM
MTQTSGARVLVTGGAGFIGSHTVEALLADGAQVRVLDNLSSGKESNLPLGETSLELIEGDITDRRVVEVAMRDVTHCLHLAAQVSVIRSVEDPVHSASQNILGPVTLLQAAKEQGLEKFVYASSAAVYGDPESLPLAETARLAPLSPYGLEKQVDEQYAALFASLHGVKSLGMRYFNVYGPRQDPASPYAGVISKFVDLLSKNEAPTVFGDGGQTRDFVYVKDVARANVAALFSDHVGVCNVATGATINLLELLDTLRDVLDSDAQAKHVDGRSDDIRHSCGDASRLKSWLGFEPEWTLAAGLQALAAASR